jgi:phosphoglycolate phosphatase-like HAD superfamily hydrolase
MNDGRRVSAGSSIRTKMQPRAVLFDLDDTLADRLGSVAAYSRAFASDFAPP